MNVIFERSNDGTAVACPVQTFGINMTAPYEAVDAAAQVLNRRMQHRVERLTAIGYTVTNTTWAVEDDDFLRNTSRIVGRITGYVGPNNWTEVDEQCAKDTHGDYRHAEIEDRSADHRAPLEGASELTLSADFIRLPKGEARAAGHGS